MKRQLGLLLAVLTMAALVLSACGKTPEQQAEEACVKLGKENQKSQSFEYFPNMLIPSVVETYVEGMHEGNEIEVRIEFVDMNIACKSDRKVVFTYNLAGQNFKPDKSLTEILNAMSTTVHFTNGQIMDLQIEAQNNGAITYINNFGDMAEIRDVSVNLRGATSSVVSTWEGNNLVLTVRMTDENIIEMLILPSATYDPNNPVPTATDNAFFRWLNTPTSPPPTPTASFTPAPIP